LDIFSDWGPLFADVALWEMGGNGGVLAVETSSIAFVNFSPSAHVHPALGGGEHEQQRLLNTSSNPVPFLKYLSSLLCPQIFMGIAVR
jgi:hypothetical protein